MLTTLHAGERDWLTAVVADPLDDLKKLVYADWLEESGDPRAAFLRGYVEATKSMNPAQLPAADGLPEEWLALIGFRITQLLAGTAPALREAAFQVARPALRLTETKVKEATLPDGVSKLGGRPDLPPGFKWPTGRDCKATYNDPHDTDRLAGFLGQINLDEIASTQAARALPPTGMLSFFASVDNDNPDALGVKCVYFPDVAALVRTTSPKPLTEANRRMQARRLSFAETLSLPSYPYYTSGKLEHGEPKWGGVADVEASYASDALNDGLWMLNPDTMLGYSRSEGGGDNANAKFRSLIRLTNNHNHKLYLEFKADDLAARNFDALILEWVDYD